MLPLLLSLLLADCTAVDRCQIARLLQQYAQRGEGAAELRRGLEAANPCPGTCPSRQKPEPFTRAVQRLLLELSPRLREGEPAAWETGLLLRRFTRGLQADELEGRLASAISSQPAVFLRALNDTGTRGEALVAFLGESYVGSPQAVRCAELRGRLAAIEGVRERALEPARRQLADVLRAEVLPCR